MVDVTKLEVWQKDWFLWSFPASVVLDWKCAEGHIYNVCFGIRVRIFQRDAALPHGQRQRCTGSDAKGETDLTKLDLSQWENTCFHHERAES